MSIADGCTRLLEARLAEQERIGSAVLCTVDGRAFAHALRNAGGLQPARMAAIASSLLALSESFARESIQGRAQYASIATDNGSIVIVRIPSRTRMHALCVSADADETFAMALRFALDSASQLAALIDQTPA